MRKVSTSLSLFATANIAAVLSLACTGADNSSGPPQTNFGTTGTQTTQGQINPVPTTVQPVQPVVTVSPVTTTTANTTSNTVTTSAASTSTSAGSSTSAAPTSAAPTSAAPTSTAATTSINNPLNTTTDDETEEPDETTSEGNPDGDPGIPIDEDGYFPSNSNVMGFQGAWYCFDDGEVDTSCVDDETPWDATEMGMCITGTTIVDATYAAWGAGIGASLNDRGGDKEFFDADAKDIKGFKFTVSGDLGDAVLKFKIPRSTKDADSPPEVVIKVGSNTINFDDLAPPDWDEFTPSKLDLSELTELKWQIAGGDAEAEYNFCITNIEPI
jgi:hypothetical protein